MALNARRRSSERDDRPARDLHRHEIDEEEAEEEHVRDQDHVRPPPRARRPRKPPVEVDEHEGIDDRRQVGHVRRHLQQLRRQRRAGRFACYRSLSVSNQEFPRDERIARSKKLPSWLLGLAAQSGLPTRTGPSGILSTECSPARSSVWCE